MPFGTQGSSTGVSYSPTQKSAVSGSQVAPAFSHIFSGHPFCAMAPALCVLGDVEFSGNQLARTADGETCNVSVVVIKCIRHDMLTKVP